MRKTKLFITTLAMSMVLSSTALAGTWMQDSAGWYYQNDDGSFPTNQWFQDFDGKWYYLNESGYMLVDGTAPDGRAVGADGAWIQQVTGDVNTVLREINNWVIGDIDIATSIIMNTMEKIVSASQLILIMHSNCSKTPIRKKLDMMPISILCQMIMQR